MRLNVMFTRKILSLILAVGVLSGLSANVFAHNNGLDFVDNLKEIIRTPGCAKSARHVFKEVKQYVKTPEVHAFCKEGKRITTLVIQNNKTKILTFDELDNCIQQFVEKFKLMCTKDPILQDAFNNAYLLICQRYCFSFGVIPAEKNISTYRFYCFPVLRDNQRGM